MTTVRAVSAVRTFPGVGLLNPVVYTPSQYPRSDAFEAVSSMGTHLALKPDAQVTLVHMQR